MILAALCLLAAVGFAESKELAVQVHLDRAGFSCNTIDGVWGPKAERALRAFVAAGAKGSASEPLSPEQAYDRYFADKPDPFRVVTVTRADLDALVKIPEEPAAKAELARLGYESVREMFAERGHLSQTALARMNPGVDWNDVKPGLRLVIPDFPPVADELAAGDRSRRKGPVRPEAALVRVSVSEQTVTAYDAAGRILLFAPCSIAADKAKVPPHGELRITDYVANPNYTYTPDYTPPGKKVRRYIWPAGENCPVGVAWMGLNLPGYGIHGTPRPESIGNAESHGCFRLANWNAARLFAMCRSGTRVIIEQ